MPETGLLVVLAMLAAPALAEAPGGVSGQALENLVRQDCGSCHGLTLAGGLGPDLRPQALDGMPADVLAEVILDGRPGTAMPPWRPLLSEAEAAWIAEYLLNGGVE
jgi:cytochrome c55X